MNNFNYKCTISKNGNKTYYKKILSSWEKISNKLGQQFEKNRKKYMVKKTKTEKDKEMKIINKKKDELVKKTKGKVYKEKLKQFFEKIPITVKKIIVNDGDNISNINKLPNLKNVLRLGTFYEKNRINNEAIKNICYIPFMAWINFPTIIADVFGNPDVIEMITGIKSDNKKNTGIFIKSSKVNELKKTKTNTIYFKGDAITGGHFHYICNGEDLHSYTKKWQVSGSNGFCQTYALLGYLNCINREEYKEFYDDLSTNKSNNGLVALDFIYYIIENKLENNKKFLKIFKDTSKYYNFKYKIQNTSDIIKYIHHILDYEKFVFRWITDEHVRLP